MGRGSSPDSGGREGALEDVAFLARSSNRLALLRMLGEGPHDRRELRETTSMSAPTLARILGEFEDHGWIERDGGSYRATTAGRLVAGGVLAAVDRADAVRRLRPLLRAVPTDGPELDVEALSNARVTVAEPSSPLGPANRFASLTRESETLREFNAASVQFFDASVLRTRVEEGRRTELLYERGVVEALLSDHPELLAALIDSPAVEVSLRESVPFGLSLFDDRIGVCGYDRESGALTVFVDTDDYEARRWAERLYESVRSEAMPITNPDPTAIEPSPTRPPETPVEFGPVPLDR
ncbi:helix-turn-helix transcriptional regulator [Natronorarus salvus]|uniref:helix-turn-helix transcriptional regulator n=1 Tax=Natronorarus salvus TaxID=3117733 RepID=UPI002F268E3C